MELMPICLHYKNHSPLKMSVTNKTHSGPNKTRKAPAVGGEMRLTARLCGLTEVNSDENQFLVAQSHYPCQFFFPFLGFWRDKTSSPFSQTQAFFLRESVLSCLHLAIPSFSSSPTAPFPPPGSLHRTCSGRSGCLCMPACSGHVQHFTTHWCWGKSRTILLALLHSACSSRTGRTELVSSLIDSYVTMYLYPFGFTIC